MTCPHCETEMDSELIDWPMMDWHCGECDYHEQRECDDPPFARPYNIPKGTS